MPEVAEPLGLDEVCGLLRNATALIVCCEEADGSQSITKALQSALTKLRDAWRRMRGWPWWWGRKGA